MGFVAHMIDNGYVFEGPHWQLKDSPLQGLYFRIDDREGRQNELRTRALDDARQKAEVYARRAGMVLGPVVQIIESEAGWMPAHGGPDAFGAAMAMAPAPATAPMPVSPGEQEVSLSVSVSYELKLPPR